MDRTIPELSSKTIAEQMRLYAFVSTGFDDGDYFFIDGNRCVVDGNNIVVGRDDPAN